jgi:hypothetical protein
MIFFGRNEYTNLFILFTRGILSTHSILYFKIIILKFFIAYLMNHRLTK